MVQWVHRILSLKYSVIENKTFKVKDINKTRKLIFYMNKVAKRNTLFTSMHCKESVYFKQDCPWNESLFGNCKVSAQHTVIAVNCRWKQDIQGKDINKTRKLIYRWIKLQKDTISLWAFIVKRVFILNSIAFKTGHSLKWYSQCKEGSHWSVL